MAKLSYTKPKDEEEVQPGEVHTTTESVKIDEADARKVAETVSHWERSGYDVDVKLTIKTPK